jgi:hypothetical protein
MRTLWCIYPETIFALIKRLTLILTLSTISLITWSQISITGKVIASDDKSALPGVNVVEKDTQNGTTTKDDGTFVLELSDPNAILVFSFIGMITQEFQLKGQRQVFIKAKWDCHKDFFDSQQIMIYANSGVINNPIGGQLNIASPWLLDGVVKGLYSYHANFNENEFQRGQIELTHYISNCDFDIDFRWSYRKVSADNNLDFYANSFESDFNFRNVKLIAGYSHLNFKQMETNSNGALSGTIIGIGTYFNIPLHPTAIAKVGIYKDKLEYQAEIQGGHKRLLCSIRFYKMDSFNELSLGIGTWIGYKIRRQKR